MAGGAIAGTCEVCRRIRVRGMVQGVNFRYLTRQRARSLMVKGWVRNRPDGTVEALACGSPESIESLIAWMQIGPSFARVDRVEVLDTEDDAASFTSFQIR